MHDEQRKDQGSGDAFKNDAKVLLGITIKASAVGAEEQREHSQNRMHAHQHDEREGNRHLERGVVIKRQEAKCVIANMDDYEQSR